MSDLLLEARDIGKTFAADRHQVVALEGVTLSVARDEVLAVVGPSGCGKTTLLTVVTALLDPTAGASPGCGPSRGPSRCRSPRRRSRRPRPTSI